MKTEKKYSDIDEDMTCILAALLGEETKGFNSIYKKNIDKLVEELENIKNTIESQTERGNLPVIKDEKNNEKDMGDNGKLACGYSDNDYSKGIIHVLNAF